MAAYVWMSPRCRTAGRTLALGTLLLVSPGASGLPYFGNPEFDCGPAPVSVACGDLDEDGAVDMATVNSGDDTVSILLNAGECDGFTETTHSVAEGAVDIAIGDLNGDAHLDVVVASNGGGNSDYVTVLIGTGSGTFQTPVQYAIGDALTAVTLASIDGDDYPEIIVSDSNGWVYWLTNDGDGTFTNDPSNLEGIGDQLTDVVTGLLDGDAYPDLAVLRSGNAEVEVRWNDGTGHFPDPSDTYPVEAGPIALVVGDVDGDSDLDLVSANQSAGTLGWGTVSVLTNDAGVFGVASYQAGIEPAAMAIADIDGDDRPDLVVSDSSTQTLCTLYNDGVGAYAEVEFPNAGFSPRGVAFDDFDEDGDIDIGVTNEMSDTVSVIRNWGDGTFAFDALYPMYANDDDPVSLIVADVNGDLLDDVVALSGTHDNVQVFVGVGDGTLVPPGETDRYGVDGSPTMMVARDLDGDTDIDLVVSCANSVVVLWNDGTGDFSMNDNFTGLTGMHCVAVADVAGTTHPDIVALFEPTGPYLEVIENNGDATFTEHGAEDVAGTYGEPKWIVLNDIDSDGNVDAIVTFEDTMDPLYHETWGFINDGSGGFTRHDGGGTLPPDCMIPDNPPGPILGGDTMSLAGVFKGIVFPRELAIVSSPQNKVFFLRNHPTAHYLLEDTIQTGTDPQAAVFDWMDTDIFPDLVVTWAGESLVQVYPDDDWFYGTFRKDLPRYGTGSAPGPVGVGKFNGDTLRDIVVGNRGEASLSVLLRMVVPPHCVGDIDGDEQTNVFDFALFASSFGSTHEDPDYIPEADLEPDGWINVFDFTIFISDFGCNWANP